MRLLDVLSDVAVLELQGSDRDIAGLRYDSRQVRAGDVFFALEGKRQDGRAYARAAVDAGAVAVVAEEVVPLETVTRARVADGRLALAQAACRYHGYPSRALAVVAVTGTNGKTTTAALTAQALEAAGRRAGVLGTVGYRLGERVVPAAFTTPESVELQGLLAEMRDEGLEAAVLEVSSHALDQRRSFGLEHDVAVFTNLSHDHLDYHRTLEAYLDAKLRLFDGRNAPNAAKAWTAVVNADDPAAARVIDAARRGHGRVVTYAMRGAADLTAENVAPRPDGIDLTFVHDGERSALRLPLLGDVNVMNALAAFGAARALGVPRDTALAALATARPVPGRLERVQAGQGFEVVVDYAHTPDALERVLGTLRSHVRSGGRLWVVFGCGGDRDRAKRPRMGEVASRLGDRVVVTSDNPRSEDPGAIIAEIVAGIPAGRAGLVVEPDRRAAIGEALRGAAAGDVVLVAGKGHETTQTIGTRVLPFDDRAVVRELLAGAVR